MKRFWSGLEGGKKVLIYSPSYKRAGDVKIREWFKSVILVVHEFEADEYREKEGGKILVVPDSLRGNIASVRNFILEEGFRQSDWVVMMDDDNRNLVYFEDGRRHTMNEKQALDFMVNGFVMCEEIGFRLWGLNLLDDNKAYREYSPFSMVSPILGPFSGHIKNPIRYDERLPLKEDYDLALQHLNEYRGILRFNKYAYNVGHIEGSGGVTAYRTKGEEYRQAMVLQGKWGKKIVKYDIERSINPILRVPIGGI